MNKNGLESNISGELGGDKATEDAFKNLTFKLEGHYDRTKGLDAKRDATMEQLLLTMQQLVMQIDSGVKPHWIPKSLKNLSERAEKYFSK